VEAARRSGTLITARMAGEQGREVFAMPGHPLDPRAEGTNALIKARATMVTEPEDILSALAPMLHEAPAPPFQASLAPEPSRDAPGVRPAGPVPVGDGDRLRLLDALGPAPVDIDELGRTTGLSPRAIQVALLELTLAGRVERHGHQLVSRKE